MSGDERDILGTLRAELDFVERGGYARWPRTPLLPASVFQDSKICLNFGYPYRAHACGTCLLYDFVPEPGRAAEIPCHHIPLDPDGTTVEALEAEGDPKAIEEKVKYWLRARIRELEPARYAGRIY